MFRRRVFGMYPFDLVISGGRAHVSRAQAIAAEQLPRTRAYMTWSEQGNALEDRLTRLWARVRDDIPARERSTVNETAGDRHAMAELERIGGDLRSAGLTYEEWEVLFRERLMVERDVLRRLFHRPPEPGAASRQAVRRGT